MQQLGIFKKRKDSTKISIYYFLLAEHLGPPLYVMCCHRAGGINRLVGLSPRFISGVYFYFHFLFSCKLMSYVVNIPFHK